MSRPIAIPCTHGCGRKFGGEETFRRHRNESEDRCRSDNELRARGMVENPNGVWVRRGTHTATGQRPLFDRRPLRRAKTQTRRASDGAAPLPGLGAQVDAE